MTDDLGGHWDHFYSSGFDENGPSSFAKLVRTELNQASELCDIGCGNGRDSAFLAETCSSVFAFDTSIEAIRTCRAKHSSFVNLQFIHGRFEQRALPLTANVNVAYCRFVLHAMTWEAQNSLFHELSSTLNDGSHFFIEARSTKDPLCGQGTRISANEWVHGHYRRFIDPDRCATDLETSGFKIHDLTEVYGASKFGDDDPVLLRIHALK